MIPVEKYHGTGNDFIVVDANASVPDRRGFAVEHCDRETGVEYGSSERVGADGVLFLALEDAFDPPRVVMTLVQPDGSTAAMCGNGARVAAQWAAERTGSHEVMIDTPAGTRYAVLDGDSVQVEMGPPTFTPKAVPLAPDREGSLLEEDVEGLTVSAVNTGVPHAVAFVDDVDAVDLESVAPPVRHADVFPEGANVTLASPDGDGGFRQRTFERGVEGETDACGTGAVAVVAVARELGKVAAGDAVTVTPPGGELTVTLDGGVAYLRGPVAREFEGELPVPHTR
ncbi:diaminopimelate epimerase [Halomarina litorea]|uniref:diaminopimelate epimerase n=1 Tax=Halomarina litorea TaxID=2961595 RepID=UPI0020C5AC7E|nr:diaminopimelate epimerase [Halomarina sp. BCD28]